MVLELSCYFALRYCEIWFEQNFQKLVVHEIKSAWKIENLSSAKLNPHEIQST